MSATKKVIDLCDSSADEADPQRKVLPKAIAPSNRKHQDVSKAYAKAASGKTKASDDWTSSDDDTDDAPSRLQKNQQRRRRKSKVVTPEDHRKPPADDKGSCSSASSGSQCQKSRRKQPRTLFAKSSTGEDPRIAVASVTAPKPHSENRGKSETDVARSRPLASSSWDADGDSSDDSFTFEPVFSQKKSAVERKTKPIDGASSKPSTENHKAKHKDDSIVMVDSSDDEGAITTFSSTSHSQVATASSKASTVINPYDKKRRQDHVVPDNSLPASRQILQYPHLGPLSGRQYEDVRAKYILALWKYCRTLVTASYNLTKLDSYCRRIKDLALSTEFPIRSLEEFAGHSNSIESSALKEALRIGGLSNIRIPANHDSHRDGYFSVAEAALVAMLEIVEASAQQAKIDLNDEAKVAALCADKEQWVYLADLIPRIDRNLHASSPSKLGRPGDEDNGEEFYTRSNTRSAEYKQLEQLTKAEATADMQYLKAHRKEKRVCYELTLRGLQKALYLRDRRFPLPPGYMRTSKLRIDSVDQSFQGICLVVDNREGGGASKKLHFMCQALDIRKVPYIVTKLDIGDYAFVSLDTGKLLPIIIERKSIQDVAQSIWDGRWTSQKLRMYQGQYVFGFENCRMSYLIEGHADGQELTDGAMGQSHFNVSRAQLDKEIDNLQGEGFEVLRTNNMNGSIAKLVELSRSVSQDYRNGKFKVNFTYEDFMSQVRAIPRDVDFSRIAKDHKSSTRDTESHGAPNGSQGGHLHASALNKMAPLGVARAETGGMEQSNQKSRYDNWKLPQLKEECEKFGLPKTGKKGDLIARLLGPKPPNAWLQRKKANLYVPMRYDTCASAILVSIWLHQRRQTNTDTWKGLEKDEIVALAESLKISKDPFTGTGKGLFNYDGWSCMGQLRDGQCPLVFRQKGGFFKLTTMGGDVSGVKIAEGMHEWCHAHQKCLCDEVDLSQAMGG